MLGQSPVARQVPQQLYAIYSDACISNISLTDAEFIETLQPNQEFTIPRSCDNPLQCGIPFQQNGLSEIYIPNKDNNSLIQLKIKDGILVTSDIQGSCVFSDFALQPNVDGFPLLIACVLTENDTIRYMFFNTYGNVSNMTDVSLEVQAVVNPIILTLPNNYDEDTDCTDSMRIISINAQNKVIVLGPELCDMPRLQTVDPPCIPLHIQKVRSNVIFLLTCEGGQSCLVNVSEEPINYTCFSLPINSTVLALANNNARYILASTTTNSAAIVTIHDVLSQSTVHLLNATTIYGADFGPGNKLAYIATNNGIDFVNIVMALEGASAENFTHRVNIPACSECPPVVFLNSTIALVTSSTLENNQLQFLI